MVNNGLYISKLETNREVKPFTVFEDSDKMLLDINAFGFEQTSKLVEDLKQVLDGKFVYEYEWSGQKNAFESSKEKTIVRDMIFDNDSLNYSTLDLYRILYNRYIYLSELTEIDILSKVEDAFRRIKMSSQQFRIEEDRYRVTDKEQIDLILFPHDITLTTEKFMSQIKINSNFIKPAHPNLHL